MQWLNPKVKSSDQLQTLLGDRQKLFYEHRCWRRDCGSIRT